MNNNLDSNTAALNAYELEQEKLFIAAEIAQDDLDMKIEELVIAEIEADSALSFEAAGTEATLKTVVEACSGKVNQFSAATAFDPIFKEKLLDAVKCKGSKAQADADKELGQRLRELVTDYIANSVEDSL